MDDLIQVFIDSYLNDDTADDVYSCFSLFDYFEYKNWDTDLIDLIAAADYTDTGALPTLFLGVLHKKLDYVLNEHTVRMTSDATIGNKKEVLTALARLQSLEDYTGVIALLESLEDDITKFSLIISDFCSLESTEVAILTEHFSPLLLERLKLFIYAKEQNEHTELAFPPEVLANATAFFKFKQDSTIGLNLIQNDVLVGCSFQSYIPYIEEGMLTGDTATIALNMLSLLVLSSDGYSSPVDTYRTYSMQLLHDLNTVSAVEVALISLIASFDEYKKAQSEKERLS